jgi:hypothetical protein
MMEIIVDVGSNEVYFSARATERRGFTFSALLTWQAAAAWSTLIQQGIMRVMCPHGNYELDFSKTEVTDGPALHVWVHLPIVREIEPWQTIQEAWDNSR